MNRRFGTPETAWKWGCGPVVRLQGQVMEQAGDWGTLLPRAGLHPYAQGDSRWLTISSGEFANGRRTNSGDSSRLQRRIRRHRRRSQSVLRPAEERSKPARMIPSTVAGALFFLFLLGPGLAYVLRRERMVPESRLSAFRETLRIVAASTVALTASGMLFALLRFLFPHHTVNIRGLVRDPNGFAADHHVHLAWWTIGFFATATLLAWFAADPRVGASKPAQKIASSRIYRFVVGPPPPIKTPSAVNIHGIRGGWRCVRRL